MTAGVAVRRAGPDDALAVERVRLGSWQAAYRGLVPDAYLDALDAKVTAARRRAVLADRDAPGTTLVAELDGEVVGMLHSGPCRDDDVAPGAVEIWAVYVVPTRWRHGVGGLLLARALAEVPDDSRVYVWALAGNDGARAFYERHGFRADAARTIEVGGVDLPETRFRREPTAGDPLSPQAANPSDR